MYWPLWISYSFLLWCWLLSLQDDTDIYKKDSEESPERENAGGNTISEDRSHDYEDGNTISDDRSHDHEGSNTLSDNRSHDHEEIADWVVEMQRSLPEVLSKPCKLSLRLEVGKTPQTLVKITALLDHIKREYHTFNHIPLSLKDLVQLSMQTIRM